MALGGFLGFEKIHLVEKSGGGGFSASSVKILPHTPYLAIISKVDKSV